MSLLTSILAAQSARAEAVANADAHLNNVGMPNYSEAIEALRRLSGYVETYMPSSRLRGDPVVNAWAVLNKAGVA